MDLNKAEIAGPCTVVYNGVNLGHTLEGVDFEAVREFADVLVDRHGSTPIDKVLTGTKCTIKFKLAQPNFAQLDAAMPETSSYDGAGTADRIDIGGDVGYNLRQNASPLVIHPMKRAATDFSGDITIYKAVNISKVTMPYKVDAQIVVEFEMIALVDESYGAGRRLGHVGPSAVS